MLRWMAPALLLLSLNAFAQETTTSKTSVSSATLASASAELQMTTSTSAPVIKSPWHLTLGSENWMYENTQRTTGNAPIISYNFVGGRYDISNKWYVELRQQFQYVSNTQNLEGRDRLLHRNNLEIAETVLRTVVKPDWSLLGSKAPSFDFRYYAPTDFAAQNNHELGRFRFDAYAEWALGPKWSVAAWISPRVLLNSTANPNKAVGADAEYYTVKAAPYLNYNFNDIFGLYYAFNYIGSSTTAQRGDWRPDRANATASEVGANINYGAFYINPSVISEASFSDGSSSFFTPDGRIFAYDGLSYNLNVYATF